MAGTEPVVGDAPADAGGAVESREPDTPGRLLAAARQKMGFSIGDIAAKLRMSVQQIDALERGDYSRLPKGTFLRGFVKSYAKLVNIEPAQALHVLEQTHEAGRRPDIVVPTQNIKMAAPGEPYESVRTKVLLAVALVIAIGAGVAYWWLQIRPQQSELSQRLPVKVATAPVAVPMPEPATSPAADAATADATKTSETSIPVTGESSPVAQPALVAPLTQSTAPLVKTEPAKPATPVVPKGSGSLRFAFNGESWVEVVEASGKTLVSRRYRSGENEAVVGKLPVSVVIGNATLTTVHFNDVAFDLAPHTRVSVARFTLK